MAARACGVGPPARLVLAWLAAGEAAARRSRLSGSATSCRCSGCEQLDHRAASSILSGEIRQATCSPGAQPMQTAPASSGKTPEITNDGFSSPLEEAVRADSQHPAANSATACHDTAAAEHGQSRPDLRQVVVR